jgi:hypothetical protein
MNIRPGETVEITHGSVRRTASPYPTPPEPHSAADLLAACEAASLALAPTVALHMIAEIECGSDCMCDACVLSRKLDAAIAKARLEVTNGENSADK